MNMGGAARSAFVVGPDSIGAVVGQGEPATGSSVSWAPDQGVLVASSGDLGVTIGTMLKDEAFYFIRLGTHLERADNTARIIDVKFHRNDDGEDRGRDAQDAHRDFYYWAAILRSVSAFEIYRKVYRDVITPARVAELLMLRPDMPRSLMGCMEEVVVNLKQVCNDNSAGTERFAGRLHAQLKFASIEDILEQGLHDYLDRFLADINELGNRVSRDFLLPLGA